jgi:hypothetical protein
MEMSLSSGTLASSDVYKDLVKLLDNTKEDFDQLKDLVDQEQ